MSYKNEVRYSIGPLINTYLNSKGIRHNFVYNKIGMKQAAFSSRMNGFTAVSAEELFDICEVLDVPSDTFKPSREEKAQLAG